VTLPAYRCLLLLLTLLLPLHTHAEPPTSPPAAAPPTLAPATDTHLSELVAAIGEQRARQKTLTAQRDKTRSAEEKSAFEQQLKEAQDRLARLSLSVNQIVLGGIDLDALSEQPAEKIDWRAELEQISLPVLASLRELTAKPRRIESLRSQISQAENKLEIIADALTSIAKFEQAELSEPVREHIKSLAGKWRAREAEVRQNLDIARLQLDGLSGQTTSIWTSLREDMGRFAQGRGLTLALAAAAGFVTWLVLRALLALYGHISPQSRNRTRSTRIRAVAYAYQAISFVLVTIAVISVFYLRNDLLLMALSIAAIIGLGLGLRQIIPRYVRESRLLLDIGPVREGERLMLDGVPYKVAALNVYTTLKNPLLDGLLRIPLAMLDGMHSRPECGDPWFPSKAGDYLLLPEGTMAQVISQSVECVQLKVKGSTTLLATKDFLGLGARNLSANGYGLAVTFGIDYSHQAIALEQPPTALRQAVTTALEQAGLSEQVQELTVEFQAAASNSLDYLIYLSMQGSAATAYFKLGRIVQQACVRVCNERGWIIPFNQLTLHPGEEFSQLEMIRSTATPAR
jgi:hypothetical protein